ncbi:hypothetical protein CABS02_00922 [Colletotrichum abscissum]|uniref:Uncharacterized protein n=1 Tax=Colletotrichum abscissum TaxID=1671311 RepID=A0A9P9XT24_9PEZI|nr:hypothetical protein CABS02_00922 [Colletotrichum abscissum]
MHIIYTVLLPALVATAEAVTCASAPFKSTPAFRFKRQSNGVWVAQFTGGYVNYAPGGLSAAGVVKLVNETPDRKVFCLPAPDDWACFWLNGHDTCSTNINLKPTLVGVIGNA